MINDKNLKKLKNSYMKQKPDVIKTNILPEIGQLRMIVGNQTYRTAIV